MCVSCLLLLSTILSCLASVLSTSVCSVGVVALVGCLPLAAADSLGAATTIINHLSSFWHLPLVLVLPLSSSTSIVLLISLTIPDVVSSELNQ
uniref:Secreted peptide n=1 Tax=Tanacetum cinerariifolium TaxID=118510 RepID=A0A699SAH6_TANCI|nr:hypothetical protein [Tanacetum cinerariifolium]